MNYRKGTPGPILLFIGFIAFFFFFPFIFITSVRVMSFMFLMPFFMILIFIFIIFVSYRSKRKEHVSRSTVFTSDRRCNNCLSSIDIEHEYCPHCGKKQTDYIICDYCGHKNSTDRLQCEECNALIK